MWREARAGQGGTGSLCTQTAGSVPADTTGCLAFLGKGKCRDNWAGMCVYST